MGNRTHIDGSGIRRGRRGGISSYQNWRHYYGEASVREYAQKKREEWEKYQREQDLIPLKPLAKENDPLKIYRGFIFDHHLIGKMDGAKFEMFLENLNEEEKKIFFFEDDALNIIEHEAYIENGEMEEYVDLDDIDFDN